MSQTYFALLTAIGEAKLANAAALGIPLQISRMAVGDGNGNLPAPNRTQTSLLRETYRADLNELKIDPINSSQIIAELVIPETEGGYWLREMGLYDVAGDMIAVSNCPPSYKPQLAEGSGRTQIMRMVLIVTSTASVQLKVDPSVVLATREFVITSVAEQLGNGKPLMDGVAETGVAVKLSREDHRHPSDDSRAPLASPAFTGTPTAPTQSATDNSAKLANTAFVRRAIGDTTGSIAVPSVSNIDGVTDLDTITQPGWFPALLGAGTGSRNLNHPDGQTAIAAGNGVANYYWLLVARYSGNLIQLALPYISGADTSIAALKFRMLGGATWSGWRSLLHSESLKEATQPEAEAAAIQGKWMGPLRVLQLIRAASANATESLRGVLRIGTQVEVDGGALDTVAVTPKKLFNGAVIITGNYAALKLPSWLGGWILQKGSVNVTAEGGAGASVSVTLPIAYTDSYALNATFIYTGSRLDNGNVAQPRDKSLNGFTIDNQWMGSGSSLAGVIDFFAFGR